MYSAALVGVVLAAGPFLFWRIFMQQLPLTGSGSATISERFDESENGVTPTPVPEGGARLRELLANPANSLAVDRTSGAIRMYEEGTGKAFEVSPSTLQVRTLSENPLTDFLYTIWSPNGHEVITLFQEENGSRYRYFDYRSSRVAELSATVRTVAFSPNGEKILTTRDTQDGTQLWISKPDGTEDWVFMATRLAVLDSFWPRDDTLVLVTRRDDDFEDLVTITLDSKLNLLLEKYEDLEVVWAPNGVRAIVSYSTDEQGITLALLEMPEGTLVPLGLSVRATKCAWHKGSSDITCGIPAQTTSASRDTVTSLNLTTGELTVRYRAPKDVWIGLESPAMSPQGRDIAFINIFDKRPYLISW